MSTESQSHGQSRRTFLDRLAATSLATWLLRISGTYFVGAVLYPITRYLVPPEGGESAASAVTLPFGPDELEPNSAKIFKFGNRPGIVLKTPNGELRAFSAACTHLGCIVQYRGDLSELWCACHNGHFDLNGTNVAGPPPRPLEAYEVNLRGDQIVVTKGS
jgi:cytochrome b6-f complex iron-sulfur subunit